MRSMERGLLGWRLRYGDGRREIRKCYVGIEMESWAVALGRLDDIMAWAYLGEGYAARMLFGQLGPIHHTRCAITKDNHNAERRVKKGCSKVLQTEMCFVTLLFSSRRLSERSKRG
jgi:hypothetical protein